MAYKWLVIKAERLKIGDWSKFNKFFYLFKLIYKWHDAFCEQICLFMPGFRQFCKVADIFLKAADMTFLAPQDALREPKARAT